MKLSKVVFAGFLLLAVSLWVEARRYSYEHIWNAVFNNTTSTIAVAISSITGGTIDTVTTITNEVKITDNGNTITTADERYETKTSTHTAGNLKASGNIPATSFNVTQYSFYSDGADSSVTGIGGTINCLDGVAANSEGIYEIGFLTPTFVVTLGTGATFYYDIGGNL